MNTEVFLAALAALAVRDVSYLLVRWVTDRRYSWYRAESAATFLLAPLAYIAYAGDAVMRQVWRVR